MRLINVLKDHMGLSLFIYFSLSFSVFSWIFRSQQREVAYACVHWKYLLQTLNLSCVGKTVQEYISHIISERKVMICCTGLLNGPGFALVSINFVI